MSPEIQATLDQLNSPRNLANGGARWGFDEAKGMYYSLDPQTGQKRYQSNTNMAGANDQTPAEGSSFWRHGQTFDQDSGEFSRPINWGSVLGVGTGALIGGNALGAALGGGAGGSVAGDVAGVDAAIGGASVPVGGVTAAAGGSMLDQLKKTLTSPGGIANLAGLVASLAAGSRSGGGSGADVMGQSPQLQELMAIGTERVKRTDPLHQAVTQLAMSRLPTNVQR